MKEGKFEEKNSFPVGNINRFMENVKGWRTNGDGDDFCPDCWGKWLQKFEPESQVWAKKDSRPTSKLAKYRGSSDDGYFVGCHMCLKHVTDDAPGKNL